MNGYAGKIIDINLTSNSMQEIFFDEKDLKNYLGGIGFTTKILFEQLNPGTDALSPDNILTFGVGTLVGTNVPTASRTEASALSPATGLFGTSNSGNYFGSELKYAGYDGIIIRGKAQSPRYIWINNGTVQIKDATALWGKDAWDTISDIRQRHGDEELQVAVIGQAGENLVRFASIENGPYDAWGRTGLGAVMGSKNLKAIVVRGTGSVKPAEKKDFLKAVDKSRQALFNSPFYGPFAKFGTMLATVPYFEFGALPGRNFQTGTLANWMETRSRKLVPQYSQRGVACISCPIACAHWTEIKEGPYAGLKIKDMEVTPVMGFAAGCDIDNLPAVAKLTEVCQRYGMDMVSAASVIAFTMELYQRELITDEDLGFSMPWGSEEATFLLLNIIAYREGVLGDILAEGTRRAANIIPGAARYAMHIKGLEIPMADARGRWSTWTFGNITNIRGGDHLRSRSPVENLKYNENPSPYRTEKFGFPEKMYENLDMPESIKQEIFDPKTRDVNIPKMSKWAEDLISLFNALGVCIRPPVLQSIGPTLLAELFTSLTGIEITPAQLMQAGERIWNLQKLFNLQHGEDIEDSVYPDRFYDEPASGGPAEGKTLDRQKVRETLTEYFIYRGWDPETGTPTKEKLAGLGLELE